MAFVSKRGKYFAIRIQVDGAEKKISGFTNKREAERVRDKVEALITANKTGEMPATVAVWKAEVMAKSPKLYKRLAEFGLVEQREAKHTLEELIVTYRESRRDVVLDATVSVYAKVEANLREFFGAECELEKITTKRASDFSNWLRTAPLNRLRSGDKPYSTATVNKRVGYVKQLFRYAVQIDWLPKNPFTYVKGGDSVNPSRWMYVASETMETVIDAACLPMWRAIMALGRFAGVRGSSELYGLLWEHVQWSSENEPGSLLIKAEKNKRHGRQFRTVPMHPIVERELSTLFHQAKEGETHVFPGMEKKTNFCTMTRKMVLQAGLPVWPNIWYNLRKSFCCDLMETGIDPTAYEAITDHSYTVAMKHYQIPHTKRLQKGYEKVLASWGCPNSPPAAQKENVTETRGRILGRSWAGFRAEHGSASERTLAQRDSQVLIFCMSALSKENACAK